MSPVKYADIKSMFINLVRYSYSYEEVKLLKWSTCPHVYVSFHENNQIG